MARKLDDVMAALPKARQQRVEARVMELATLKDLRQAVQQTQEQLAATLGVLQQAPRAYLQALSADSGLDEASIEGLIVERTAAKAAKNFAEADRIRKQLAAQGIELKDSAAGTTWVRA